MTEITMSIDKVLKLAKTITTIEISLPHSKTMLMARYQNIAKLYEENF